MEQLTTPQIRQRMLEKLAGSALTEQDARTLKIVPCTATEAAKLKLSVAAPCFLIPYFTLDGKLTKFFRARYVIDPRTGFAKAAGKKAIRYAQPPNTTTEVYLPPLLNWRALADNAEKPLIITEGELKAACATAHGHPTIGLGGVWSFQSAKNNSPMLPIFDDFDFKERLVYICYDSDAVTNPKVVAAEIRLAQRLTERGADVRICRMPSSDELIKVGLDDYLVLNGVDDFQAKVLDSAFEYAPAQVLHSLNNRVLYVRDPGFIWDHETRQKLSPSAFKEHAFSNVHYTEVKYRADGSETMVKVAAAKAWLEWEHRAEVRGLTYEPGADRITEKGLLNVWSGWGVDMPVRGSVAPWHHLLAHLFGKDTAAQKWFEQWCAYPIQHPGAKMSTATALWGHVHGSGKTLVGETLMRLYGPNAAELKDADLDDERAQWAENKQFALADDITARGDRTFMRRLMTMVTQTTVRLNPKYVPSYVIPDLINYMFTSNDPDALYMDDGDRRFWIHEVLAGRYDFKEYVPWMKSDEGIAALWHYFLEMDLTGFDPKAPAPQTAGKESMIELGKSDLGAFVRELRDNGAALLKKAGLKGDLFSGKELHAVYDPAGNKRASPNALSRELKRVGFQPPATGSKLHLPDGTKVMAYAILNPMKWRDATWKQACDHYIANHSFGPHKERKF